MQKSQFSADTYGVGELITQRKIFIVPEHQRNFSWTTEEVEEFLSDVSNALDNSYQDYFIGLIVLQGPISGNSWQILDGQQRLATTIMAFSAIREWLRSRNFDKDSEQIETEFIRVRKLGDEYSSRLLLNIDNQKYFNDFIINSSNVTDIEREIQKLPKLSSNRKLLESALFCRKWIEDYSRSNTDDKEVQANKLFALSIYLEKSVKVICVDVSNETDAYIIFESLNHRGVDLSALDLIKNYIFRFTNQSNIDEFRNYWEEIAENIDGKDADDFLKVFWTSRHGIVRKVDLFNRIRDAYSEKNDIENLIRELADASIKLNAIDDPEHEIWQEYGTIVRDRIFQFKTLGSKQVRPVILAALSHFDPIELSNLLWYLVVLIVRYQLIGKERTGRLEQFLGQMSQRIWDRRISNSLEALSEIKSILPSDEIFVPNFTKHIEFNSSRLAYILSKLDVAYKMSDEANLDHAPVQWRVLVQEASPYPIFSKSDLKDEFHNIEEITKKLKYLGNYVLLEDNLVSELKRNNSYLTRGNIFNNSNIELTKLEKDIGRSTILSIDRRSEFLAMLAIKTWNVSNPNEVS